MILVDTSVWVDHLRHGDAKLVSRLTEGQVLIHPFIIGELALGSIRNRNEVLRFLKDLPQAVVASEEETCDFIESHRLFNRGIGYVDAHLLASARLTGVKLWTHDKRLCDVAIMLKSADNK
jgi:predicted nucleic acid-binding protein